MKLKETNDSKLILILIPVALTILKMLVYIPVNVTGGLTNLNYSTHTHIIKIVSSNTHISKCEDCVHYSLIAGKYWIENLIVFAICFAIVLLFYIFTNKPSKKKEAQEDIKVGNDNVMGLNIIRNNEVDNMENQMVNVSNDDSDEIDVPTTIKDNNMEQSVQTVQEPQQDISYQEQVQGVAEIPSQEIEEISFEEPQEEIPVSEIPTSDISYQEQVQGVAEIPSQEIEEISFEEPQEEIPVSEIPTSDISYQEQVQGVAEIPSQEEIIQPNQPEGDISIFYNNDN